MRCASDDNECCSSEAQRLAWNESSTLHLLLSLDLIIRQMVSILSLLGLKQSNLFVEPISLRKSRGTITIAQLNQGEEKGF